MRAFLALPIADAAIDALLRVQARLPVGKPVPEENMHLTLAYLGEVPEVVLDPLHDLLSSARLFAPEIAFSGLDTFAEMERGLVFAGVQSSDALTAVQSKVTHLARTAGAALPRRRFRPHVTLMRSNRQPKGPARDRLAVAIGHPIDIPAFTPVALNLYHSDLTPKGARHEVLASYPLS